MWKVFDDDRLMDEAFALAGRLAEGPPASMSLIKAELEAGWSSDLEGTLDGEASAQSTAFATDDLREGASAFVAKRKPNFSGR